jgi:hypothetical protein
MSSTKDSPLILSTALPTSSKIPDKYVAKRIGAAGDRARLARLAFEDEFYPKKCRRVVCRLEFKKSKCGRQAPELTQYERTGYQLAAALCAEGGAGLIGITRLD